MKPIPTSHFESRGRAVRAPILLALALAFIATTSDAQEFFLKDGQTVLFVGDSNTFADKYVQYVEAFLFTRFPEKKFTVLNRGLPSETVAGTSETTHVPPRPDFHTRFARTVPPLKPDVLVACYGMNDGIYQSLNEPVFAQYRDGLQRLIGRTRDETKARLVLLTPPPFDPTPFRKKPATTPPDYRRPADDYDLTLARFTEWLLTFRKERIPVIDLHTPINRHLAARRENDPAFILAGDGVHLDATGHWLMAQEILLAWNAPALVAEAEVDAQSGAASGENVSGVKLLPDGGLRFLWKTPLPLPLDPKCDARSLALANVTEQLNRYRLTVKNAASNEYHLEVNTEPVATVTRAELAAGLDLTRFSDFPTMQLGREVLRLVQQRRQVLLEAWARNDSSPRLAGMFKNSKATLAEADALEARIRQFCQPKKLLVHLAPVLSAEVK